MRVAQTGSGDDGAIADFYDNDLDFDENDNPVPVLVMRIADGGNVGIGVSRPQYKLEVDGEIYASGDVIMFSDARYKTNIQPLSNVTDLVAQLNGIRFNWIDGKPDDRTHIGLIAQDVEKVLPEAVYTDQLTGKKSVAYPALAGAFAQALNETNERLKTLEKQMTHVLDQLN